MAAEASWQGEAAEAVDSATFVERVGVPLGCRRPRPAPGFLQALSPAQCPRSPQSKHEVVSFFLSLSLPFEMPLDEDDEDDEEVPGPLKPLSLRRLARRTFASRMET